MPPRCPLCDKEIDPAAEEIKARGDKPSQTDVCLCGAKDRHIHELKAKVELLEARDAGWRKSCDLAHMALDGGQVAAIGEMILTLEAKGSPDCPIGIGYLRAIHATAMSYLDMHRKVANANEERDVLREALGGANAKDMVLENTRLLERIREFVQENKYLKEQALVRGEEISSALETLTSTQGTLIKGYQVEIRELKAQLETKPLAQELAGNLVDQSARLDNVRTRLDELEADFPKVVAKYDTAESYRRIYLELLERAVHMFSTMEAMAGVPERFTKWVTPWLEKVRKALPLDETGRPRYTHQDKSGLDAEDVHALEQAIGEVVDGTLYAKADQSTITLDEKLAVKLLRSVQRTHAEAIVWGDIRLNSQPGRSTAPGWDEPASANEITTLEQMLAHGRYSGGGVMVAPYTVQRLLNSARRYLGPDVIRPGLDPSGLRRTIQLAAVNEGLELVESLRLKPPGSLIFDNEGRFVVQQAETPVVIGGAVNKNIRHIFVLKETRKFKQDPLPPFKGCSCKKPAGQPHDPECTSLKAGAVPMDKDKVQ